MYKNIYLDGLKKGLVKINDFYYIILIFWIDSIGGSIIVVCVGFCWIVCGFGIFCGVVFGCRVNNFCFYIRFGGIVVFYKEIY